MTTIKITHRTCYNCDHCSQRRRDDNGMESYCQISQCNCGWVACGEWAERSVYRGTITIAGIHNQQLSSG